uniref:hypothetical protein n=1 Tax=Halarcobacter sp. TaxID=2321133 RepID=UPI003A91309B
DSNFELIKKSNNIINPSYSYNGISFNEIEKEINELSYDEREKNILEKDTDRTQNLYNEIKDIEKKQKVLNSRTISELCTLENMNEIIGKDIEDKKGLLKFLILNGFIDENYYMFLSYSFNKSLTSTDTEFLKAVINNISVDFDFNLTNLNEIVNKLRVNEFKKSSILNFNLVGFLLENKVKFSKQYEVVFRQLVNGSEKSLDFIFDYLKILPKHNSFIIEIVNKWKGFWEYIYNSDFTEEGKEELFYKILTNISVKNIVELNTNNTLKNHIENLSKIIELDENGNTKLKELLKLLDIKFTSIKAPILNKEIFDYMYLNNHYTLNKSMIEQIIYKKYAVKEDIKEELKTNHLTTILLLDKDGKLIKRIEDNIEVYIDDIFLEIETNDSESEETIIKLLNNESLNNELKEEIIKSQKLIIEEASKIKSNEILDILVQNNKIETTWNNINALYSKNGFNKTLMNYLNNTSIAKTLSKTKINSDYCEENKTFKTKVLKDILESNEIDIESYKLLIKSNGYWYETFDIYNLNEERIDLLLEYSILQVTRENIEKLIECSSLKYLVLIEKHFNKFIDEYDSIYDLLSEKDYIQLLKSNRINIEQKFKLFALVDIENFDINEETASLFRNLYLEKKESMSFELLNKVNKVIAGKGRLELLVSQLNYNTFSSKEIIELLKGFSFPYNRLCMRIGSYETLPNSEVNLKLVKYLESNNCISSFSEKGSRIRINRFKG